MGSQRGPIRRRMWLTLAILAASAQLSAACGLIGNSSFACSDEGAALFPELGKDLRTGLAEQAHLRVDAYGQCYEGRPDNYDATFESPNIAHTLQVLKRTWPCVEGDKAETIDTFGSEGAKLGFVLLKCSISGKSVNLEVDHDPSLGRGGASAYLVSAR